VPAYGKLLVRYMQFTPNAKEPAKPSSACVQMLWGSGEDMAPWALFNRYRWSSPMSQHFRFDASRSLTALEQDSTIVAV
jgi:hypothetical protein